MLKIEVKPGESIERALKRYKRKYRNTKRLDQIRSRQEYTKKSVERRKTLKKAQYKEQFLKEQEDQTGLVIGKMFGVLAQNLDF